jgi:alkanesulfonate monooxygenase SsuD/methylene tetrahydromethanopterin reductase-like flavin-dependent oxidoreductase (luciferase family)
MRTRQDRGWRRVDVGSSVYGGLMRFGFVVPYADAREFAELAALGEQSGWDAVFTWEAVWGEHAWVTLGAAAMLTERIKLGTLLTPASRWRPWDLASAVGTVDRLSKGRVVMSVGLGALRDGWTAFEPDEGRRARAEKLDECLAIYDGLMRGQPFAFDGKHYSVKLTDHLVPDPPAQRPRPPVWVVGTRVVGRAARAARPGSLGVGRGHLVDRELVDYQEGSRGPCRAQAPHLGWPAILTDEQCLSRGALVVAAARTEWTR